MSRSSFNHKNRTESLFLCCLRAADAKKVATVFAREQSQAHTYVATKKSNALDESTPIPKVYRQKSAPVRSAGVFDKSSIFAERKAAQHVVNV